MVARDRSQTKDRRGRGAQRGRRDFAALKARRLRAATMVARGKRQVDKAENISVNPVFGAPTRRWLRVVGFADLVADLAPVEHGLPVILDGLINLANAQVGSSEPVQDGALPEAQEPRIEGLVEMGKRGGEIVQVGQGVAQNRVGGCPRDRIGGARVV